MPSDIFIQKKLISVKSLDGIRLQNNQVLCRQEQSNIDKKINGLYRGAKEFEKNQFLYDYAQRGLKVIKVCERLSFEDNFNRASDNALRWKTTIQIEEGDTVITSYPSVLDYVGVLVGDEEYIILNYSQLRIAYKPNGDSVLLNGWQLYKNYYKPPISTFILDPYPEKRIDWNIGVIFKTGNKNMAYRSGDKWIDLDSNLDIKEGDYILKPKTHKLLLEHPTFRNYSGEEDLFLIHIRDVFAKLSA